ncbi:MAG TPA: 2-dehydropantoate 2-reductase N-terminal domain-containing protein, partial [Bacillota bacterium]|nr:2-dehydropantoate 2-reductase N-terminal domain-containing protein [Bacillota bacterium]
MKVTVLGCGRWGTFLAWYTASLGNEVYLWGRPESTGFQQLAATRKNEYLQLPVEVQLGNSLAEALAFSDYIIISISAQNLRLLAKQINEFKLDGKTFILCMKGLES